jgi:hypothetical protein
MAKIHNLGEVVGRSGPRDEQWLIEIAADGHERSFTFGALHRAADAAARGPLNRGLKRRESVDIRRSPGGHARHLTVPAM